MRWFRGIGVSLISLAWLTPAAPAGAQVGYYRQPGLHEKTLVFVAEGDVWKVGLEGGVAARLTSHPGDESIPAISPDGKTLAFAARYEGPTEVYTMPLSGGRPTRRTFDAGRIRYVGWTPDGKLLYSTDVYSTLPNAQLVALDISGEGQAGKRTRIPLAQAADGVYDDSQATLYFTRLPFQGSHTKRYKGGTAQNLWRFGKGDAEAAPLTSDFAGTSKRPMWWSGRVYFASDRSGTMNIWSMTPAGGDLKQHTRHSGLEVKSPSLAAGRIAYQLGASLRIYDIAADQDQPVPIRLSSDLDQTREHWIEKPISYMTSAHLSRDGERVVLTARGQVFVAPRKAGRLVEAARKPGVRYRQARFMPDGKSLLVMSDVSGEVEWWTLPANGVGDGKQVTFDGDVLRWGGVPSPDGKFIAHHDKNQRLFVYEVRAQTNRVIDESSIDKFGDLSWSPDSRWLAYRVSLANLFKTIRLYHTEDGSVTPVTTDRYDSTEPVFSADGKWLYFLSDRNLHSIVRSPWGNYQPEPFLDKKTKIYQLALQKGLRSPFAPADELHPDEAKKTKNDEADSDDEDASNADVEAVRIDLDGIAARLAPVPAPPGNYRALAVNKDGLFWLSSATGESKRSLVGIKIARDDTEVTTLLEDVASYELSGDGEKLLVRKGDDLHIIDAKVKKAELKKSKVDLSAWTMSIEPREEWRQMFVEAWRLERDYFYDRDMHGVDWNAMREKYTPMVDRVRTRAELSDLIAQMVSELSALHIFVYGGDLREGEDDVMPASLGALLVRDEAGGGYRVEHIYRSDPDEPERTAPLARPGVHVNEGDVIEMVNGTSTLSVADINLLLRHKAGRQVLLRVKPADGEARDVIVSPISTRAASDLRYHEWEYTRRLEVDELSENQIGYVHLRAMGGGNFSEWARNFYPVFNRKGLIVDVRHNRGGNIDSWIIGRLMRKAWFHWSQRVGAPPSWNMQYAFRGHVVVLCNERTASDGEAFTEGVKRLGIGKVIGTRTWGGEIWLSSSNFLVDRGIATAAEYGVYGPEGEWLIEGHGVEPDIVIDNLPHATFNGEDAQLMAAVAFLKRRIEEEPVDVPPAPAYPDKSGR